MIERTINATITTVNRIAIREIEGGTDNFYVNMPIRVGSAIGNLLTATTYYVVEYSGMPDGLGGYLPNIEVEVSNAIVDFEKNAKKLIDTQVDVWVKTKPLEVINVLEQSIASYGLVVSAELIDALIDELTNRPGVYLFYAENKQPLYIGKSNDLRSRVMGHFQSALSNRKEMKLSLQVRGIDWIETGGELGALLLESRLIKEKLPSFNIKLRRSKDLCAWQLLESPDRLEVHLVNHQALKPGKQNNLYGLFYSKREAL